MNRSILLGLAMVASSVIGATAVNGLHAQNKAPGAYAALDLRAINSPDVFKTLPSKTGDFADHTTKPRSRVKPSKFRDPNFIASTPAQRYHFQEQAQSKRG